MLYFNKFRFCSVLRVGIEAKPGEGKMLHAPLTDHRLSCRWTFSALCIYECVTEKGEPALEIIVWPLGTQTCFPSRYRAVHLSDTFSPPFLSHSSSLCFQLNLFLWLVLFASVRFWFPSMQRAHKRQTEAENFIYELPALTPIRPFVPCVYVKSRGRGKLTKYRYKYKVRLRGVFFLYFTECWNLYRQELSCWKIKAMYL